MKHALLLLVSLPAIGGAQQITGLNRDIVTKSGRLAITGTGFGSYAPGSQVSIGGSAAHITTWTDSRIVAFVDEATPSGPNYVVVTTASGSSPAVPVRVTSRARTKGREQWRFEADDQYIMTRPVAAPDGTIYAKGINGHTYALTKDGGLKWVFNDGLSSPADMSLMADGTVVVGGANHVVALWPDGTLRWDVGNLGSLFVAGPTVGPNGNVYGVTNPLYGGVGGFEISPNGQLLRTVDIRQDAQGQTYPYEVQFDANRWYFCLPGPILGGWPELYAVEQGGQVDWVRTGQGQSLRLPNGLIFTVRADDGNNYGAYSPSGQPQWTHAYSQLGSPGFFPGLGPDGSVYHVAGGTRLVRFSPGGSILSSRIHSYFSMQYPAVRPDGQLVLVNGLTSLSEPQLTIAIRNDGSVAWTHSFPREGGVNVAPISRMAFSLDGNTVYQGSSWNNGSADRHCYLFALSTSDQVRNPITATFLP